MKRIDLTTEWLANWKPKRTAEVADRGCKGLVVRAGVTGGKTFYVWADEVDEATGRTKRKRVNLGRWPALSLPDARTAAHKARGRKASSTGLVREIAESFRRDVLVHQEQAAAAWRGIETRILEARPDPARPPFGDWLASAVRPPDVAALVRFIKEPRTVEGTTKDGRKITQRQGGPRAASVALRDLKAIFEHAVGSGALEMSPAAVLRARAFGLRGRSRGRVLEAGELRALFNALDLTALLDGTAEKRRLSPTVRLGVAFQVYCPLRSHSLIGARWEEVDFGAKLWTVPVDRLKLKKEERAAARPFVVPLPKTAVAILERLRELAGSSPWVLTSPARAKPGQEPRRIEDKTLIHALTRLQGDGRLDLTAGVTVHDLRRTWRSMAMDLGIDNVVAERSLGHVAALRAAGFGGAADVYGRGQMVEQRAAAAELVAAELDRIRLS